MSSTVGAFDCAAGGEGCVCVLSATAAGHAPPRPALAGGQGVCQLSPECGHLHWWAGIWAVGAPSGSVEVSYL